MNPSRDTLVPMPRDRISPSEDDYYHSSRLRVSPERDGTSEEPLQQQQQQQQASSKPLHEVCKPLPEEELTSSSDELSESLRVEHFVPINNSIHDHSRRSTYSHSHSNHSSTGSIKMLSFDNDVSVLEFNTIIGDNPGVSGGCPVALGMDLSQRSTASLRDLDYEHAQRKAKEAQKLSFAERAKILHNAGFSVKEIATATYETLKAKEERRRTNRKMKWDNFHGWMESVQRKVKKMSL